MNGFLYKPLPYLADSLEAYSRLRCSEAGFLLQSGNGYSDHVDVFSVCPTHLERLDQGARRIDLDGFIGTLNKQLQNHSRDSESHLPLPGWYGALNYQLGQITERVSLKTDCSNHNLPLAWVGFFPTVVVTDHNNKTSAICGLKAFSTHFENICSKLTCHETVAEERFNLTTPFSSNLTQHEYGALFGKIKEYLRAGDCYQVNLAHRFSANYTGSPWSAYASLKQQTNAPMTSFFETRHWSLLSMSPERFISCRRGKLVTSPIKGTRPRLKNPEQDQRQKRELQKSKKDRAENLMIVDLLRNDLGRSCKPGSIKVPSLFSVETFTYVHHLVSTIEGELRDEVSPLEALLWAFPGGSITGAPKHRAMEIIDELEQNCRGFYCGSALYYDVSGKLDSSILIRSLVAQDGEIECWAGGGIVEDSVMEQEYQETFDKVQGLLNALS